MERYEAYKDSGVEWIGEIPEGWSVSKLGYCLLLNQGGIWGTDPENNQGTIVLRSTEQTVDGKWIIQNPALRNLESEPSVNSKLLEVGDLVVTKSSGSELHIGKTTIVDDTVSSLRCSYSNFMQRLRTNERLVPRFCWYLLNSNIARSQYCYLQYSTSGIGNLNAETIADVLIPLPATTTQQAIADYLDAKTAEVDALVADCEREVELLREYCKAVISEAVTKGLDPDAPMKDSGVEWIGEIPEGWEAARLDKIAIRRSGHTPDKKVSDYWNGDIVWISLADSPMLRSNTYISTSKTMTTPAGIANSSAELLPAGSVLLSRDASIGLTAIARVPLAVSQHFMAYICGNNLLNTFLRYVFLSMSQEFERLSMGSTIPTIGLPLMKQLTIPYPPRHQQEEIVIYLDEKTAEINVLIEAKQSMADKLRKYRKSLISEAVTGKFKVEVTQ